MPRITTQQSHDTLKKEYRSRFFALLFWLSSLSVLFAIVFLLPSYLLLNFYQNTYHTQGQKDSQAEIQKINEEYGTKLEEVYQVSLKVNKSSSEYVDAIEILNQYSSELVMFDALELNNSDGLLSITVRGRSATRDQLLTFENKVNNDARFEGFKIPIEVLTKKENLSFSVTFTYHEN